jgi:multidrug efflux pump subunit AcrA (membrane-fusion protein)
MSAPADLSKLRIDRSTTPAPVRRALGRNIAIFVVAAVIVAVTVIVLRTQSVPVVQVATASVSAGTKGGGAAGATSVTAHGYVVARAKASVSAKTAGRLAFLGVSEGSDVHRGEVIARLDNADYQASVSQAQANVAAFGASVIEATSDRDQTTRDAQRISEIRARNANLMSPEDLETRRAAPRPRSPDTMPR